MLQQVNLVNKLYNNMIAGWGQYAPRPVSYSTKMDLDPLKKSYNRYLNRMESIEYPNVFLIPCR